MPEPVSFVSIAAAQRGHQSSQKIGAFTIRILRTYFAVAEMRSLLGAAESAQREKSPVWTGA
jgi:hypothetical protein